MSDSIEACRPEETMTRDVAAAPAVVIRADFAECFTYASYQNAVPVLKSVRIVNAGDSSIEGARLTLTASPTFLRSKTWRIERLAPGEELDLSDRKVDLDPDYLAGLDEAERGEATLLLSKDGKTLARSLVPVRLLARDEWGGVGGMAELLPAFVMPNDPAVAKLLRAAADRLADHGHSSALDGYQSNDPRRAYMLSAAIYAAVAGLKLHYAEPPVSFETRGQKVRRPSTVLADGLGTCLDTSLVMAAALEAAGLNPVVLLVKGHAFAGVWLTKRTLPRKVEPDVVEIRKAIAGRELVVFETTGVTHRPPMGFEKARRAGEAKLGEQEEAFVCAIDIARSRSGGITPLASHIRQEPADVAQDEMPVDLPLPPMPDFAAMPEDVVDEKPTTPEGRIDRWQRKLLDLSLRNRLLNLTASKSTVPFVCPDPACLEDRLAQGVPIRIVSLPEQNPLGERDAALYRETRGHDLQRRFAADALQRDELASPLDPQSLDARLTALYRQARSDLAEGGTNTLYMAVGFLRWKKKPTDERVYRAPLLLIPVKLERRSASSQFRLLHHEDDVRFNATLLQFLQRDFDLTIPALEGALPVDESGIDVPLVLERMRQAVRDVPGFEVVDETTLATFSFAKFLMWKDLTERTDALRRNRVVRHLIDTPDQPFASNGVGFRDERQIDTVYAPSDIVTPLPADSSQIVASLAAAEGKDFVVVGPPGTGKSQTIANMIANCLASRRTVLFVAEKTAALDVVYRRLREHGLGDHCLELHSNKADRRHFVGQLKQAWENGHAKTGSDWIALNDRLKLRRDELNAYVEALHQAAPNGLTPFRAIGIAMSGKDGHAPDLRWPSKDAHDRETFADLEDLAAALGRTFAAVEARPALDMVAVADWSSAWQENFLSAARDLKAAAERFASSLARFGPELGLSNPPDSLDVAERCVVLAIEIAAIGQEDLSQTVTQDLGKLRAALALLRQQICEYEAGEAALSARFERAELARVPVDDLDRRWREAAASIWPLSWLRGRSVRNLLQSYAASGKVDVGADLPVIRAMQAAASGASESPLACVQGHFAGIGTDVERLESHIETAERLRLAIRRLDAFSDDQANVGRVVPPQLASGEAGRALREAAARYAEECEHFAEAQKRFETASGRKLTELGAEITLSDIAARMVDLADARGLLRDWSSWCAVRERAIAHGLGPLVHDVQAGAVPPDEAADAFRLGYVRWWLPQAIDADARLRAFRRFQHEHAIDDFRQIDDLVRMAASLRVREAVAHGLPASDTVPRKSELGILRYQMELKRPSRSIRDMIAAMPASFPKLAPCVLMSPLSIAQYLPPDQALFDVVIFDEASQITTWDAVGAVARGKQTIIVGDPKQLPPTNFFGRNEVESEEIEDYERDLESILDEAKASGLPVHDLRWHYRSRNESLIAFSNWHYYDNRLITFPSPLTEDRAVSFRPVANAVYDRGKSRTNKEEARAVAREVSSRLRHWLKRPEGERPTVGVITFNSQQQALIQDLLDEERRADPELEWFFADERIEPVFVKNLENVQGDERDVILFSITFAKDAAGKLTMNFGALNGEGGERRLNVAVTRARQELMVVSGLTADEIDTGRTKALGVHHLKAFLDYAKRGPVALPAADAGSLGAAESPFEAAVAEALKNRGWQVVTQVGVSGFRIDIGVKHPDRAGAYLAGIECDGATYHRSATARDRDKVREQVLRGLGWSILRVWSTDWWFDKEGAFDRLEASLQALLKEDRAVAENEALSQSTMEDRQERNETEMPGIDGTGDQDLDQNPDPSADRISGQERDEALGEATATGGESESSLTEGGSARLAGIASTPGHAVYRTADLSAFPASADSFYDPAYAATLQAMVDVVIETEAPVREDILAQRIARAHGRLRTGKRIREQVERHLESVERVPESAGVFLWKAGSVADRIPFRTAASPSARRSVMEMPSAELRDLIASNPGIFEAEDPALVLARSIGIDRLSVQSRGRLEEVIGAATGDRNRID